MLELFPEVEDDSCELLEALSLSPRMIAMLFGVNDSMVLNKEDQWVDTPQRNAEWSYIDPLELVHGGALFFAYHSA